MEDDDIETACSFPAGTHGDWRPDAADHPDEVLGRAWAAWAGRFVGWFDFAITEACLADGRCADMAPYRADATPNLGRCGRGSAAPRPADRAVRAPSSPPRNPTSPQGGTTR